MLNKFIITTIASFMLLTLSAQSDSDVLMTVGNSDVTLGEFKYIYEKNNGQTADYSKASLDEYIDLYTKFKLKVAKAKEMKLDTIVSLQKELQGYRTQLANSYLTDKEVLNALIDEMIERKHEDVKVSHILINLSKKANAKQKDAARKKLINIKQQLREGKSFAELAKEYSEDKNTKEKGGDLGYITAVLPAGFYELENAMYTQDVNEISDPIETKLGMHLVKVLKKRPARGRIEVAHIFRKVNTSERNDLTEEKKLMDSIYTALQGGASFKKLADKFSDDKTTKSKGGVLPAFGIAVYDSKFEDAAFALKENGQISRPILTSVGYHIIKKIKNVAPETKDQLKAQYKERIRKYDRYNDALDKMITKIKEESKFTERPEVLDVFIKSLDDTFFSYKWKPAANLGNNQILSFGPDANETLRGFANFAKRQTRLRSQFDKNTPLDVAAKSIYNEFVKEKAYAYEQANLESKYPEFKSLMREYQEGILLFEATKINVWDKANTDTIGLYKYYEQNKSKYIFEEQATIGSYIINTTDEKQIKKIMKCAKKNSIEKTKKRFNKNGLELIEYVEMNVEPGSKELAGLEFKKQSISQPIIDTKSGKSKFKKIVSITPSRRKSLKEARGYVVADYQDQLEKQWISDLKKQYPIEIKEAVYQAIIK